MLAQTRGQYGDRPLLLEIGTLSRSASDYVGLDRDWTIVSTLEPSSAEALLAEIEQVAPDLVLAVDTSETEPVIEALRYSRHPSASTPIVLTGPRPELAPRRLGHDAYLCEPIGGRLAVALSPWRPLTFDAYERLEAIFGAAALTPMLARLREDLTIGLKLVEIESSELSSKAHHLGGICGMLGFERTGSAWRSIFEAPESDLSTAWRETRLAIAALDKLSGSRTRH